MPQNEMGMFNFLSFKTIGEMKDDKVKVMEFGTAISSIKLFLREKCYCQSIIGT